MSEILNEHLGHLEHLHHQNSRRHPATHRTRANGPKWTHLDPPFETHLRSKWRKMLHFESTPFADRGTTQEQSTSHIACPRGKPARSFPLRPPQTRHKSTARRSKAHRHQSPRSAERPVVLAAEPRDPRASPDWLHGLPTNEPGAPGAAKRPLVPSGEAKRSEGEPRLATHPNPPTSPGPEHRATFSPADEVHEFRGRAPTC